MSCVLILPAVWVNIRTMITGYNTDVKHRERVLHVQTEDKGVANPMIESLIYSGGKIIASRNTSYAWLVQEGCTEKAVQEILDAQHRKMLRDIKGGKYDEEGPPPFGTGIISDRDLDDVVREFIEGQLTGEGLELIGPGEDERPCAGAPFPLELVIRTNVRGAPVVGASVVVKAQPPGGTGEGRLIFQGATDDTGRVATILMVPDDLGGGSLHIEARGDAGMVDATLEVV